MLAFHFFIRAVRAIGAPLVMDIRPDWLSFVSEAQQSRLQESLFNALFCDNQIISSLASDCLSLFIPAAGDRALTLFSELLPPVTSQGVSENVRLAALSVIRKIYESDGLRRLPCDQAIEIIASHVAFFYTVMEAPSMYPICVLESTLSCLVHLIPLTPNQFAEANEQLHLRSALHSFYDSQESLYPHVCPLVFTLLTTYYGDKNYNIDCFVSLTFTGIDSEIPHHAVTSFGFWRRVCRFEMDRERNNEIFDRFLSNVPGSDWWANARDHKLVPWSEQRISWLSRRFALTHAQHVVDALFVNDEALTSSAQALLDDLMYSNPASILSAVQVAFTRHPEPNDSTLRPLLLCLGILNNTHQRRDRLREFFQSHAHIVRPHVESQDDAVCESALFALRQAVECHGLCVIGDELPDLLSVLASLIPRR
jgi:hypothetical protein